jgi:hypothetical protein
MMTREEFFAGYAARSSTTVEELIKLGMHAEPCDCGHPICDGWQAVSQTSEFASTRGKVHIPTGSGDFSIGSKLWPGTSKVIEEMGELQQVLGKLIAVAGDTKHWDGDLRKRLIEEIGDLSAALVFFQRENLTKNETLRVVQRCELKLDLFKKWHKNPEKP